MNYIDDLVAYKLTGVHLQHSFDPLSEIFSEFNSHLKSLVTQNYFQVHLTLVTSQHLHI